MIHYIVPLIFHHPDIAASRLKRIILDHDRGRIFFQVPDNIRSDMQDIRNLEQRILFEHPLLFQAGDALLVHPQHLAKGRLLHAD